MPLLKNCTNSFCLTLFCYYLLYYAFSFLPLDFQKHGFLSEYLNFSSLVQNKATEVAPDMSESNLGLNFIGNMHKLSLEESQIFQNSGLIHLLAISGGQILPLVSLVSFCLSSIIYHLFKSKLNPHLIMILSSKVNAFVAFVFSLFIALLFGGTGALLRVSWLNFFQKLKLLNFVQRFLFKIAPNLTEPFIDKFSILILIAILFGNIFINYSFLLSALGASCAELSACFTNWYIKKNKKSLEISSPLQTIFTSRIFIEILMTIITCLFIGSILSPLTTNSLTMSCLANIFAIPIVTFLVTPMALLVLVLPRHSLIFDLSLKGLDNSLMLFKHIAFVFSDFKEEGNSFSNNIGLFSSNGLFYLNVCLILLWSLIDIVRHKRIFNVRLINQ